MRLKLSELLESGLTLSWVFYVNFSKDSPNPDPFKDSFKDSGWSTLSSVVDICAGIFRRTLEQFTLGSACFPPYSCPISRAMLARRQEKLQEDKYTLPSLLLPWQCYSM